MILNYFFPLNQARYLVDEVKDKSGQHIDALSWKQEGVKNLPLQENGYFSQFFFLVCVSVLLTKIIQ